MYSVLDYGRMATDNVRMEAYERAIAQAVRPGSVVLDCGAGTGIMALLALRAGAKRVHAVDPNPAVLLASELARENGFGHRLVAHQSSPLDMAAPEPIDVVIADIRGATPLIDPNLAAVHHVAAHWLAPSGVVIPLRDRLRVVLVEAEAIGRHLDDAVAPFAARGLSATAIVRSLKNQAYSDAPAPLHANDVLSSVVTWATLEYGAAPPVAVEGGGALEVKRAGRARGLAVFFEAELAPGISYDTAPGKPVTYSRLYLPFAEAVRVERDDRVDVTLRADIRGTRWAWDTTVTRANERIAQARQSTFLGEPASLDSILRGSDGFRPNLLDRGARLRRILEEMNGTKTVVEIANAIDPGSEPTLDLVRSIAMRYAR